MKLQPTTAAIGMLFALTGAAFIFLTKEEKLTKAQIMMMERERAEAEGRAASAKSPGA